MQNLLKKRKFQVFIFVSLMVLGAIPFVSVVAVKTDYSGKATQVKAFIDVEANVTDDDDDAGWHIATARLNVMGNSDYHFNAFIDSAAVEQDFGRTDENDYDPMDLVDLDSKIIDKDFTEEVDSAAYNATITTGLNTSLTAIHVVFYDVRTINGGSPSIVQGGYSTTTSATITETHTYMNSTFYSTQKSIYLEFDTYNSSTATFLRSVNTTNMYFSEVIAYSGKDLFASSKSFDAEINGVEFDASAALNGNVTGDSKYSSIVRAMLAIPDRITGPDKRGYSEFGGFTNLHETLKGVWSIDSGDDYNLTKFDVIIKLPNILTNAISKEFDELIDVHGDNTQGWQTAYNSLRGEFIRTLGLANFDDVPLDGKSWYNPTTWVDKGGEALAAVKDTGTDWYDAGGAAVASAVDGCGTCSTITGAATSGYQSVVNFDLMSSYKDSFVGKGVDVSRTWLENKWDGAKNVYHGFDGVAGFFNNIKDFFEDNWTWILVLVIAVFIISAMYLMRRRSASVGGVEASL